MTATSRFLAVTVCFVVGALSGAGCAGTMLAPPSVSQLAVLEVEQSVLTDVYSDFYEQSAHYDSLSWHLAVTNAWVCPERARRPVLGFKYLTYRHWREQPNAAGRFIPAYLGMTIQSIVPGSPADGVLVPGDVIFSPGELARENQLVVRSGIPVTLALWRGSEDRLPYSLTSAPADTMTVTLTPELACPTVNFAASDEATAFTDGKAYFMTSGMAAHIANEDEAALVMAHELGHIIADHVGKRRQNAIVGALLGGLADGLAGGAPAYGPSNASLAASAGAVMFSREFEEEADYIAVLLMERAGFDAERGAELWRRLAANTGLGYSATHPSHGSRYANTVARARIVKECAARFEGIRYLTIEKLRTCGSGGGVKGWLGKN